MTRTGFVIALLIAGGWVVFAQAPRPCGMQLNDQPVVFCDQFDAPAPVTNRSGQLDGKVWGVSRQAGGDTVWAETTIETRSGPRPATSIGATDVIVEGGQLRVSVNDNHDVAVLALYPKQPFNFTNRTGTIGVDVSIDTAGPHAEWIEIAGTDQPVPVPFTQYSPTCAFCSLPRNSFWIRLEGNECQPGGGWRVGSLVITRNYVPEYRTYYDHNETGALLQDKGCASLSTGPNGGLNHIEVRVSKDTIDVYATDAGTTSPLKLISQITRANLSFTQGLVWISEAHYNAEKAHLQDPRFPDQRIHTTAFDNFGFDGPPTYRDISADVLDNTVIEGRAEDGQRIVRTGWWSPADVTTLPLSAAHISAASNALLMFSWGKDVSPTAFTYTVNGHANTASVPPELLTQLGFRSLAVPVPLTQLVPGPQRLQLSGDASRLQFANINIVLVRAEPVPGAGLPPPPPPPPPPTPPPASCLWQVRLDGVVKFSVEMPLVFCTGAKS